MLSICLSGETIILETGVNRSLEVGGGIGRTSSGAAGADSIWDLIEASMPQEYDFSSINWRRQPHFWRKGSNPPMENGMHDE